MRKKARMKKVTVTPYCDGVHDTEVVATVERTVSLDGDGPKVLDLCTPCDESFELFYEIVRHAETVLSSRPKIGRPPGTKNPNVWLPCPEPGCSGGGKGATGLGIHTTRKHGKSKNDYPSLRAS